MTALKWLLPLSLLVSQLAHAQQAPAPAPGPAGLVPEVSLPPAPAQAAPVPTTQKTYPPGPYIQPPAGSLGAVVLPAYPGTPPYRFASPAELAEYGTWRVERLSARERGLSTMGRPPNYIAKRIGGFAAMGAGALTLVACVGYFLLNSTPNTSENEARRDRAFGLLALGGVSLVLGGGVWLHYIKRDNPYREEMADLRREQREWRIEIKRARRTAKIRARTSFNFTGLQVRF